MADNGSRFSTPGSLQGHHARVAKLADAADLKSAGAHAPWGFDPLPEHTCPRSTHDVEERMRGRMRSAIWVTVLLLGLIPSLHAQVTAPLRNSTLFARASDLPGDRALVADIGKQDRQSGGIFIGMLVGALGVAAFSDSDGGWHPSLLTFVGIVAAGGLVGYLIESVRTPDEDRPSYPPENRP